MPADTAVWSRERLVEILDGVPDEQLELLNPFLTALAEASKKPGGLAEHDINQFREHLNLERVLPEPTITELVGVTLAGSEVGLGDQITAGGYDWFNDDITVERFPLTLPAGPQYLVLAHFDADVESEQVETWAAAHGYELALIDDLLAVGSQELQRKFPIVALGSSAVIRGRRFVPCLDWDDSCRPLDLICWAGDWREYCRFLLRKVSKPSVTLPLET